MLVVVHHWYVEAFLESLFDIEAFGSLDILEVYTTECGCNLFYCLTEFLWVFLCHFNIKHVYATIDFKKQSLAFHYGFAAQSTYISESEHGSSITDYGHKISLVCISVCIVGVSLNLEAWKRNTW